MSADREMLVRTMAREVASLYFHDKEASSIADMADFLVQHFAEPVAACEREECAQIAASAGSWSIATAIRTKGAS